MGTVPKKPRPESAALPGLGLQRNNLFGPNIGAPLRHEEALAESNPTSAQNQRDVSASLERLGGVLKELGDLAGACKRFESSLRIDQRLAESDPTSTHAQRDLISDYENLANLPGGERLWAQALRIALALQSQGRAAPSDLEKIDYLREKVTTTDQGKP
jgi:hypothetical protein